MQKYGRKVDSGDELLAHCAVGSKREWLMILPPVSQSLFLPTILESHACRRIRATSRGFEEIIRVSSNVRADQGRDDPYCVAPTPTGLKSLHYKVPFPFGSVPRRVYST